MSADPIKVVHIITRLDLGGAQRNTLHTVRSLDPKRFSAVLVCGAGGVLDEEVRGWPAGGPRSIFLPDLVREVSPRRDLRAFLALRRLLLAEKPQVVHTHSSKAGILGRFAARAAGVPVVAHTFHGFGFHERQPWWLRGLYVLAERWAAALSTVLLFVSRDNQDTALRCGLGDPRRYALLRSGIKLSEFPARGLDAGRKKASLGLEEEAQVVLSVGNFKPQKNPEDFLALARGLAPLRPGCAFLFAGDGPLRGRLESGAEAAGLGARFVLPGWRTDVAELLAVSDVFVLTSLWEGLPRALVEAMKSGVPPVCYATDGVRDLVQDGRNGFLVPQGDLKALTARVLDLLSDPALRGRLGAAAAAAIGPEFDIDAMVRRQEELYLKLARQRRALPA